MRFMSVVVFPLPEFPNASIRIGSDGSTSDSACGKENSGPSIGRMSIYCSKGSPSCNVILQHQDSTSMSLSGWCDDDVSQSQAKPSRSVQQVECIVALSQRCAIVRRSCVNAAPILHYEYTIELWSLSSNTASLCVTTKTRVAFLPAPPVFFMAICTVPPPATSIPLDSVLGIVSRS